MDMQRVGLKTSSPLMFEFLMSVAILLTQRCSCLLHTSLLTWSERRACFSLLKFDRSILDSQDEGFTACNTLSNKKKSGWQEQDLTSVNPTWYTPYYTCTRFHGGNANVNAYLSCTTTRSGQPMDKSVLYTFQISLPNPGGTKCLVRTKSLMDSGEMGQGNWNQGPEIGSGRHQRLLLLRVLAEEWRIKGVVNKFLFGIRHSLHFYWMPWRQFEAYSVFWILA